MNSLSTNHELLDKYNDLWEWMRDNNGGLYSGPWYALSSELKDTFLEKRAEFLHVVDEIEKTIRIPHYFCWADRYYDAELRRRRLDKWFCVRIDDLTQADAEARINVFSEMFSNDLFASDELDDDEAFHSIFTVSQLDFYR